MFIIYVSGVITLEQAQYGWRWVDFNGQSKPTMEFETEDGIKSTAFITDKGYLEVHYNTIKDVKSSTVEGRFNGTAISIYDLNKMVNISVEDKINIKMMLRRYNKYLSTVTYRV